MPNIFWDNFYSLCVQRGTKPNPVAKEIGISSGIVTKWKSTGTLPNGETLIKIADYLDCSVDYLLGRTGEVKTEKISQIETSDKIALLVDAYKKNTSMQNAVDTLLGIDAAKTVESAPAEQHYSYNIALGGAEDKKTIKKED